MRELTQEIKDKIKEEVEIELASFPESVKKNLIKQKEDLYKSEKLEVSNGN